MTFHSDAPRIRPDKRKRIERARRDHDLHCRQRAYDEVGLLAMQLRLKEETVQTIWDEES